MKAGRLNVIVKSSSFSRANSNVSVIDVKSRLIFT